MMTIERCGLICACMLSVGTSAYAQVPGRQPAIERLAAEDDATLASRLDRRDGGGQWRIGFLKGYIEYPHLHFSGCVGNHRVARLFAQLQEMPPAEASELCSQLFTEYLQRHRDWAHKVSRHATVDSVGLSNLEMSSHRGLCATVFLSAFFCPPEETLRQIDAWQQESADLADSDEFKAAVDRLSGSSMGKLLAGDWRRLEFDPDPLFVVNVYAHLELSLVPEERRMFLRRGQKLSMPIWNRLPVSISNEGVASYREEDVLKDFYPFEQELGPLGPNPETVAAYRSRVEKLLAEGKDGTSNAS